MAIYHLKSSGEAHYRAKLTDDQVREIRAMREAGARYVSIARKFGIASDHVRLICLRRLWKHIK